jgi:hypothetical protein
MASATRWGRSSHPHVRENAIFNDRKLVPSLGFIFEECHFRASSASWISVQKSFVLAISPSSSSIGKFEQKRKSLMVFL